MARASATGYVTLSPSHVSMGALVDVPIHGQAPRRIRRLRPHHTSRPDPPLTVDGPAEGDGSGAGDRAHQVRAAGAAAPAGLVLRRFRPSAVPGLPGASGPARRRNGDSHRGAPAVRDRKSVV